MKVIFDDLPNIFKIDDILLEIASRLNYFDLSSLLTVSKGLNRLPITYRYERKTDYLKSIGLNPTYIARLYRNKNYHKSVVQGKPDFRKLQKEEINIVRASFERLAKNSTMPVEDGSPMPVEDGSPIPAEDGIPYSEYRSLLISFARKIQNIYIDDILGRVGDETLLSIIKPRSMKYGFVENAVLAVNDYAFEYAIYHYGYTEVVDEAIKQDNLKAYLKILEIWKTYCDQGKNIFKGYEFGCSLYNSFTGFARTDAVEIFKFIMLNPVYQFSLPQSILPNEKEIMLSGRNHGMGDGCIGEKVITLLLLQGYNMMIKGKRGDAVYVFTL